MRPPFDRFSPTMRDSAALLFLLAASWSAALAQVETSSSQFLKTPQERQAGPDSSQQAPVTLTLKDALELAQKNDPTFLAALSDAAVAAEDLRQARASRYPT